MARRSLLGAILLLCGGCALYSEVSISPLIVNPAQIERGSDLDAMLQKGDFLRAIALTPSIDSRARKSAAELLALGKVELASGRYDSARHHLRAALDLAPFHTTASQIEWTLSQCEYMTNNFEASLDWAERAVDHGLAIKRWHLDFLRALSGVDAYRVSGLPASQLPLRSNRPDIPRVDVRLNARKVVSGVIDTGAVMTIVSERLAGDLHLRTFGEIKGTFYGLLGEPISVRFGILDSVTVGDIVVQNVPVAIMPDDKMLFVYGGKREFKIDLLIGTGFLKEFRTDLDFPNGTVTFTRLGVFERRPAADQNLFVQGFRPFVRATVNRRGWFMFVLDTGSEVTFLNEAQAIPMPLGALAPRMHDALLQGLGGSKKSGTKVENVEVGVDRWAGTFKTLPMYSASDREGAAGIVGENFLRNFRVIIDYGRMRVDLIRGLGMTQVRVPESLSADSQ